MSSQTAAAPQRFDHVVVPVTIFLGLVAALVEAVRSPDPRMVMQAWTFGAAMAAMGVWYMWYYGGRVPADESRFYADDVVKAGVFASMFWGLAGMAALSDTAPGKPDTQRPIAIITSMPAPSRCSAQPSSPNGISATDSAAIGITQKPMIGMAIRLPSTA